MLQYVFIDNVTRKNMMKGHSLLTWWIAQIFSHIYQYISLNNWEKWWSSPSFAFDRWTQNCIRIRSLVHPLISLIRSLGSKTPHTLRYGSKCAQCVFVIWRWRLNERFATFNPNPVKLTGKLNNDEPKYLKWLFYRKGDYVTCQSQ